MIFNFKNQHSMTGFIYSVKGVLHLIKEFNPFAS